MSTMRIIKDHDRTAADLETTALEDKSLTEENTVAIRCEIQEWIESETHARTAAWIRYAQAIGFVPHGIADLAHEKSYRSDPVNSENAADDFKASLMVDETKFRVLREIDPQIGAVKAVSYARQNGVTDEAALRGIAQFGIEIVQSIREQLQVQLEGFYGTAIEFTINKPLFSERAPHVAPAAPVAVPRSDSPQSTESFESRG